MEKHIKEAFEKLNKKSIRDILIEKIKDAGGDFNLNNIYQISWDLNIEFDLVKKELDLLISENIVNKCFYEPYEKISSKDKIGNESYEKFSFIMNNDNLISVLIEDKIFFDPKNEKEI